jgi:hypothetical protein
MNMSVFQNSIRTVCAQVHPHLKITQSAVELIVNYVVHIVEKLVS